MWRQNIMKTTEKEMDMLNGGIAGKLILFSLPLAFSSFLILQMLRSWDDSREIRHWRPWEAAWHW